MAIAAISGDDSFSLRFFRGYAEEVEVPVCNVIHALVTDPAYENGWILAHSHMNGVLRISKADMQTTCSLAWISDLLEVPMVDHWIFDPIRSQAISVSVAWPSLLEPKVQFGY